MAAFPVSVSDILKLLEHVPVWKTLVTLLKRVADLEARVATLETEAGTRKAPAANECPRCGAAMRFESERDDPVFGDMGTKQHTFACDGCGQTATRQYKPAKGYG